MQSVKTAAEHIVAAESIALALDTQAGTDLTVEDLLKLGELHVRIATVSMTHDMLEPALKGLKGAGEIMDEVLAEQKGEAEQRAMRRMIDGS